ncbi:MAG: acyl-CoA synthetase FdrA [Anaerolineae bacterium]|nr:acyl-CoA synthetase FdrA [Anaerolineae bacterium]
MDSVSLMNVARDLKALPGIEDAALVMGTDANKRLLTEIGALTAEVQAATPNDLIVMVKGDEPGLDRALTTAEHLLERRPGTISGTSDYRPRTLRGAIRAHPDTNLVVISVAGAYAAAEAWDALRRGVHVLLFSDNVSLEDEIALKTYAVEHGLLLMGPGAGTALINGVALGFANVVPRGPVGIVSAAGTGLQEVSSLLASQGVGVSQGIGVGGRDLSEPVGGLMMLHALKALQADPDTQVIVAISKLPSPTIAQTVLARLESGRKPAVVIFMGAPSTSQEQPPGERVYMARTLHGAALVAAALAQGRDVSTFSAQLASRARDLQAQAADLAQRLNSTQKFLRGLFSGGTLCEEAMRLWSGSVGDVWSNGPLDPRLKLPDSNQSRDHCALDLGEEEFTVGRPHPMIDNDLRIRRLLHEARDPQVAVIQMDIVLGYGAHPDPASELAPAIRQAREIASGDLLVITAITGTDADPQNRARQAAALEASGALVLGSTAEASQLAAFVVTAAHSTPGSTRA